jgi:hypothetical protein
LRKDSSGPSVRCHDDPTLRIYYRFFDVTLPSIRAESLQTPQWNFLRTVVGLSGWNDGAETFNGLTPSPTGVRVAVITISVFSLMRGDRGDHVAFVLGPVRPRGDYGSVAAVTVRRSTRTLPRDLSPRPRGSGVYWGSLQPAVDLLVRGAPREASVPRPWNPPVRMTAHTAAPARGHDAPSHHMPGAASIPLKLLTYMAFLDTYRAIDVRGAGATASAAA